jgi:tRNA (guanine-N7-)-methyltransferase
LSVRRGPRLSLEELAPWLVEVRDPDIPLAWPAVFGNDRPVEIEVGFGKGLFLLTASEACPDVNFLGIEIVRKYQLFTATRLAMRQRPNVRLICGDARLLLARTVPPESVQAVHVYFPDPWWKHRHHKRRLFTLDFAAACARVLRPGGRLHFVSDVEDYFVMAKGLLATQPSLGESPPPDPREPQHDLDYLTNFERKFRKEGRPIYRAAYERLESSAGSLEHSMD